MCPSWPDTWKLPKKGLSVTILTVKTRGFSLLWLSGTVAVQFQGTTIPAYKHKKQGRSSAVELRPSSHLLPCQLTLQSALSIRAGKKSRKKPKQSNKTTELPGTWKDKREKRQKDESDELVGYKQPKGPHTREQNSHTQKAQHTKLQRNPSQFPIVTLHWIALK